MKINLPSFDYNVCIKDGQRMIFDVARKTYVKLTPEEWVRQHILHFLVEHKGFPLCLVSIEGGIKVNGLQRRFDIVCFDKKARPIVLVECKAPQIPLTQKVLDQASNYNSIIKAPFILITNGMEHICLNFTGNTISKCEIPDYSFFLE